MRFLSRTPHDGARLPLVPPTPVCAAGRARRGQTTHTTLPSGDEVFEFPSGQVERHLAGGAGGKEITFPDGTVKAIQPDGVHVSTFPDGVVLKEYPEVTRSTPREEPVGNPLGSARGRAPVPRRGTRAAPRDRCLSPFPAPSVKNRATEKSYRLMEKLPARPQMGPSYINDEGWLRRCVSRSILSLHAPPLCCEFLLNLSFSHSA